MYMNRKVMKLITLFVLVILSANLGFAEDTYKNGVPYVTLNNGQQMPRFGIGTFNVPGDSVAADAVSFALKNGYRHIDTAHAYRVIFLTLSLPLWKWMRFAISIRNSAFLIWITKRLNSSCLTGK